MKLVRTKLSIQGLVHCSVVDECNLCSRWIFNLTVSVETLVYQRTVDSKLFNMCIRILVEIVRFNVGMAHILFDKINSKDPFKY